LKKHNGPWTITETALRFQNDFIEVREDQVIQPDGEPGSYATVKVKPGVCVLPLDEDGSVYLTRQFRYALGQESLETATGAIEEGESPLEAAQRELREELGFEAEAWADLGTVHLDTSIINCPVSLFLAQGLRFVGTDREGTETIRTVKMPLKEALEKVAASKILHGPSCALLLKAHSTVVY
jgi:8-oxo-dGTP pyrophosphatase MutT (NUDIX family)